MRRCLAAFFVLELALITGCGDDSTDPAPIENQSAENVQTTESAAATQPSEQESAKLAEKAAAAKKPKPGPAILPLESEPKLLLSEDEIREGWIQLFDGQTLVGWTPNSNVNWHVNEDGEIEADAGDAGLLLTTVPFADYELRCEFWASKDCNSGIFLRTPSEPTDPAVDCYELNICDSHPKFKTASLVGRVHPNMEVGGEETWKSFHIRAEGNRLIVKLDGDEVLDHTDESEGVRYSGQIGLQKNSGLIRFRNVFLKPLSTKPLFNGEDLTGWRVVPGSKSEFTVEDAAIVAKNGPGFLETEEAWNDFVFQFEAKTNGDGLNSGVFFRLIPGTEDAPSNGYELQIEHMFADDDRTQPKDRAGTGAIFRRTQARWVVPNDREWFTSTLIAHGPRIAVWVNGFQVTDWEDTRKPDSNPRRGAKVEAGPLSLQGHDPTTDLVFRNLRVAAYPEK